MSQNYFYPSSAATANPANGTPGQAAPTTATEIAGKDAGGLLQVPLVTSTRALAVDGSAVTQPVNGTVVANQGTAGASKWLVDGSGVTQPVSAAALPLPAGASTSALQTTGNNSLGSIDGKTPALGQALAGASVPVVLTAAQLTTLTPLATVSVSSLPALATGANVIGALSANQSVNNAQVGGVAVSTGNGVSGTGVQRVAIASDNTAFSTNSIQSGTWTVQPGNTANTTAWLVAQAPSSTATLSSVASSATTVSLLASNTARKGMTVFNESTAILYLAYAATASTTAYTVQIPANSYYELPFIKTYTGAISGIWSAANGNARITELS